MNVLSYGSDALAQSKSDLTKAEFELKLELGRQQVAQREWQLLGSTRKGKESESDLALRKPHLDKAMADVASAKATVEFFLTVTLNSGSEAACSSVNPL